MTRFVSAMLVIPHLCLSFSRASLFIIHIFIFVLSSTSLLSFRSEAEESAFASPPHPIQTVISTEAGHASPSCAAEKPLYLRVPSRATNTGVSPLQPQTTRPPVEMTRFVSAMLVISHLCCHSAAHLSCHPHHVCHSAAQRRNLHLPSEHLHSSPRQLTFTFQLKP
jgi:hypothetical protein